MKGLSSIIIIIGLSIQWSFAQYLSLQQKQDSLIHLISIEKNPAPKADLYLQLIQIVHDQNPQKALEFCEISLDICKKTGNTLNEYYTLIEKARCYINLEQNNQAFEIINLLKEKLSDSDNHLLLGKFYMLCDNAYSKTGNYDDASQFAFLALKEYTLANDTSGLSRAYYNIALNYDQVGDYKKALESYILSRNYAKVNNEIDIIKDANNNIGTIYDMLDENERALECYYLALNINNKLNDQEGIVLALNNIGSIYIEMKEYDNALGYLVKALNINKSLNQPDEDAILEYNIGDLYLKTSQFDSAHFYIRKSIEGYKKLNDYNGITDATIQLGDCYFEQKNYHMALENYNQALEWSIKHNFINFHKKALVKMGQTYAVQSNLKKAYNCLLKAEVIADSILLSERREDARITESQLNLKEKANRYEEELSNLRNTQKIEELRRYHVKITLIIIIALAIAVVGVLFWIIIKARSVNHQLLRKNKEIEEQKELFEISNMELREQYIFTETLLNTIPNPVFYTNKSFKLLGFNQAFEKICARTPDELIGVHMNEISSKSDLKCDFELFCNRYEEKHIRQEGKMQFSDNEMHDVIYFNNEITDSDGNPLGRLGIIIDITDLRQVENTLKESKEQLREALNAKDKFFNIVAHDLKNPFNAILGLSNFVSENYESHSPEEIRKFFSLINTSSNHVYNLLDNLLEWARAQSGSIEKVPVVFFISEPINECLNLLGHSIDSKHIKIIKEIPDDFQVFADKNMILTVLRNLIGNAIKYTPDEGKIEIKVKANEEKVYISVIDNGIGIPTENISKLFRIDQPVTTPGLMNEKGTGLGLIICKEFIKQNEGELIVESHINEGSSFTFSLTKA